MKFSAALVGAVLAASIAVADVDPIVKKVRPSHHVSGPFAYANI
jgi:hypothetical protein